MCMYLEVPTMMIPSQYFMIILNDYENVGQLICWTRTTMMKWLFFILSANARVQTWVEVYFGCLLDGREIIQWTCSRHFILASFYKFAVSLKDQNWRSRERHTWRKATVLPPKSKVPGSVHNASCVVWVSLSDMTGLMMWVMKHVCLCWQISGAGSAELSEAYLIFTTGNVPNAPAFTFRTHSLLHELITRLQHWLILTLIAHFHPTFLQLSSFTNPRTHWGLVRKTFML